MIYNDRNAVINLYEDIPISNGQQVAFTSRANQAAYFNARRLTQQTGAAYLRHAEGYLEMEVAASVVVKANYISFINPDFEGIPFYGSVTDFEYVNANNIRVHFAIDWWQTFMFDVKYRSSMIEREHLSEIGWGSAVANPYRNDIPELLTSEDLTVGKELEIPYKRDRGEINLKGKALLEEAGHPDAPSFYTEAVPNTGYPGLAAQMGRDFNVDRTADTNLIVFQVAEFDDESKDGMSDFFISTTNAFRDAKYRNGFGRGYFLAVLDHATEGSDYNGRDIVVESMMDAALKWFAGKGLTSQILGIWSVPAWVMNHDIHYVGEYEDGGVLPPQPATSTEVWTLSTLDYDEIEGFGETINDPKLRRSPFRYYRITAPDGTEQMLPVEFFDNSSEPKVRMYGNFDDTPSITVVPQSFNGHSIDYQRRLVFDTYPQIGYTTDAYLTFLASKHQESLANATRGTEAVNESSLGRGLAWLGDTAQAAKGVFTNPNGAVAGVADAGRDADIYGEAKAASNLSASQWQQVANGDVASKPFEQNRGAFIADIYHAGNAAGSLGTRLEQDYFDAVLVTLQPKVLRMYDDYLTCYGYASRRLGVPRVAAWVQGDSDAPHFVNHDGTTFTYVKTESLKVYGAFAPACQQIAALFNSGVRMINGEA